MFSMLFWGALAALCLLRALDVFGLGRGSGFAAAALSVLALVAAWFILPWDPRASRRRKLAAPVFLATIFAMGQAFGGVFWALPLYPLAITNWVFLFGFGRGVAYAVAVLVVVFADGVLSIRLHYAPSQTWGFALGNASMVVVAYAAVAVFFVGVCAPILEAGRRRRETEALLEELEGAHAELASAHAELREYAGRVRELAIAQERARVAREIHDSLGHHLTAITLRLEHARRSREKRPEEAWEEVGEARGLVSSALSEVRRAVRALKPLDLEERSGTGALGALARSFDGTGREVSFRVEGAELPLSEEAELALYRTMQEGLTNALKHSGAGRVLATLAFGDGDAKLTIADDGEGAPEGAPENGFGLRALRERAEALGGTLRAGNAPDGEGFVLEARLPADIEVGRR